MESNQTKPSILVVEDEASLARYLQLELEHEGYAVEMVHSGLDALSTVKRGKWDLILLDLMLPGLDGMELCRRIRKQSDVPIIMLTARDAVTDKVKGLDTGADDYLTKPFVIEELLARIRARLRVASTRQETNEIRVADLVICPETRQVTRAGQSIALTRREFDLLAYLAENNGYVMSRETLLSRVWGYDYYGNDNVVDVYIRYLRAKVDEPFSKRLLQTVRGVGYTLREENQCVHP